jgi:hypothetical protein
LTKIIEKIVTPPVFAPLTTPLPALDWHARARMYRDQAIGMPDIVNGQPNWPRYFLLAHAAELAIRAVLVFSKGGAARAAGPEPGKRELSALYEYACKCGLKSNPQVLKELSYLSEIHKSYVARYPKSPGQVWLASEFDDAVDSLLADTWQHIRVP